MQTLTQPSILLKPFAEQGDKNIIPDVNTDASEPQRADFTNGYPAIVSLPPDQGGLPPERKDFNALGYLTTTYDFFYQAGGVFTFDPTISAAIGGYPIGARLWYTDSDGKTVLLRSSIGNNTNNFLTDPTVIGHNGSGKPWIIEQFAGVDLKLPILSFQWSDHLLNDFSWLRADTFSWQSGDVYAAAYNHLADDIDSISSSTETIGSYTITYYKAADGHKIVLPDQEETVSNIYAESGVAWYFVLDTTNKRFKLPRTKFGFTGYRGNTGKYVEAGLPNITGKFSVGDASGAIVSDGAFQNYSVYTYSYGYANPGNRNAAATFDASRSSSVYGNSTTVQPPATQMYLYFYVGNYNESAIEQTAGLNAELFNGKVDLNAANLSDAGKSLIAGLGMPSDAYEDLTLGASGTEYTAPENGWFCVGKVTDGANQYISIKTETNKLYTTNIANSSGSGLNVYAPVFKGQKIKISYTAGGSVERFVFIYSKGSESEES